MYAGTFRANPSQTRATEKRWCSDKDEFPLAKFKFKFLMQRTKPNWNRFLTFSQKCFVSFARSSVPIFEHKLNWRRSIQQFAFSWLAIRFDLIDLRNEAKIRWKRDEAKSDDEGNVVYLTFLVYGNRFDFRLCCYVVSVPFSLLQNVVRFSLVSFPCNIHVSVLTLITAKHIKLTFLYKIRLKWTGRNENGMKSHTTRTNKWTKETKMKQKTKNNAKMSENETEDTREENQQTTDNDDDWHRWWIFETIAVFFFFRFAQLKWIARIRRKRAIPTTEATSLPSFSFLLSSSSLNFALPFLSCFFLSSKFRANEFSFNVFFFILSLSFAFAARKTEFHLIHSISCGFENRQTTANQKPKRRIKLKMKRIKQIVIRWTLFLRFIFFRLEQNERMREKKEKYIAQK